MSEITTEQIKSKFDVKSKDILDQITKSYASKIVGEENNVKFLFCSCVSKDLPKQYRLSSIITSQSSAGKSNLLNNVLQPFKDDVIDYTDYTPAFLQRQEVSMNGKIFKIEQMEGTNDKKQVGVGKLKFLMSEGKLRIGLVDRNDKGKNEPRTLEVNGIPVFLSTSTNYSIDPESLNRTFLMQVDESEEQTRKINEFTFTKYKTLSINDKWNEELSELKNIAKIYKDLAHRTTDIVIPFDEELKERIPTRDVTIRRDLPKILNLTNVIAFIHASNRIRIQDNEGKNFLVDQWGNTEKNFTYAIIAEPSDFKEALTIAGDTIRQTINKLNESSIKIHADFLHEFSGNNGEGVTTKDMSRRTGLSQNRVRELMNQLLESGFLSREKQRTREFAYFPSGKVFEEIKTDDIDFSRDRAEEWAKEQIKGHEDRLEIVFPE